ncbi:MAG: WecB/TagA/CpsF family glycosyltransferase [Cyanobacteria bacterium J06635_15]
MQNVGINRRCGHVTLRAPVWMQKTGLEWLHRLFSEPRRLLKRTLVANTFFLWLLFQQHFKRAFAKNV